MATERFSLEGWKFGKWLKGNWKTIKEVIKVGVPYIVATSIVQDMNLVVIITGLGKFFLDVGDYYLKSEEE